MRRQYLNAKSLGRVMPAVENVQTQFLRHGTDPMLPFARDERVHLFVRQLLQIAPLRRR